MIEQRYLDDLTATIDRLWELAHEFGLRPFPTHFELVPATIMYEFGAYGMPGRFSHWTHGRAFQRMKTMYDYGLSKIYELVINTNPSYAYLLDSNSLLQNKFVVAHVLGHTDFFANNAHFAGTSRRMVETINRNAERIARYAYEHGEREVERLLDAALALEEHIDPYAAPADYDPTWRPAPKPRPTPPGPYDDLWERGEPPAAVTESRGAHGPYHDLLLFLSRRSPVLDEWERDVLDIVRQEALYFLPQMKTKVLNEGWAVFWHLRLMRALDLTPEEYMDFAGMHAGVLQPSRRSINPYYLGHGMLEALNRAHGGDATTVAPVLFELRERESDVSLVRNYLTQEMIDDLDLYLYEQRGDELVVSEKACGKVRDALVATLLNQGHPIVSVQDGDYQGNRELYLLHDYDGQGLDLVHAEKALEHVYRLWGRRVHLETRAAEQALVLSYDPQVGHTRR